LKFSLIIINERDRHIQQGSFQFAVFRHYDKKAEAGLPHSTMYHQIYRNK